MKDLPGFYRQGDTIKTLELLERIDNNTTRAGDCLLWNKATVNGRPRLSVGPYSTDARRTVWESAHRKKLPSYARLGSICGNGLCCSREHVVVKSAPASTALACPTCAQTVSVPAPSRGAFCSGRPGSPHTSTGMGTTSDAYKALTGRSRPA